MRLFRVLAVACVLALSAPDLRADIFTQIVSFGDSVSDTGNVFLATGSPPPPYFNGHYSNGPIWLERLADRLGIPEPTPSLLGGTDNAWGGAETGLSGLSTLGTPNIGQQITNYLAIHPTLGPNQLVTLLGGNNDILFAHQTNPLVPVNNLGTEITTLHTAGATNFLVVNLPLLGNTPALRGSPAQGPINALVSAFNSLLDAKEMQLETTLGIKIYRVDLAGLFQTVETDPAAYGLTNVTDPAFNGSSVVPNPDQYLFWDTLHPTRVGHEILAGAAEAALPEPSGLVLAFLAGVGVLAWRSRRARQAKNGPCGSGNDRGHPSV